MHRKESSLKIVFTKSKNEAIDAWERATPGTVIFLNFKYLGTFLQSDADFSKKYNEK